MKLKFCLIIICLIIFGCKNEEPLITKEGILIYKNGIYYLKVETETPTGIYEIINADSSFDSSVNCRMKITGKIIIVDNVKKIDWKYLESEIMPIY